MQKRGVMGGLEGSAAKAHTLLAEDTEGWRLAVNLELFIIQVMDLFTPPAESALACLAFEEISQKAKEAITRYYSRKLEAFHQAVRNPCAESFMYFKDQTIRGIYAPYIRQKVIEDTVSTYEELR